MLVSSITFSYPAVDGSVRAELARRLIGAPQLDDVFVLSTCLRIEVVAVGDETRFEDVLTSLFDGVDTSVGNTRRGEEAVHHLFRVAAGLESPILGEREILSQFRQSVVASGQADRVAGLFTKLLETAVSVGRQARELLPGSPHASMAAVAAQVVGGHRRVAIIGSGLMSTAVVTGLQGLPAPPEIVVVSRNPEKVSLGGVEVWPFERAVEALATFPAVVSATSAKYRPLADEEFERAVRSRTDRLLLLDMAMPPDFAPPASTPVDYVDIDMLARMADRRPRSRDADAMVAASAADAFRGITDHHTLGPVIGGLTRTADDLVDRVVDRFSGRLAAEGDRDVLRQAVHTAARTLLAGPIAYIRSSDRPEEAIDVIAEAFGVEDA
ncbi:MAG: hypothetical protein WD184_03625 [Acidimicrobiia bacterium]